MQGYLTIGELAKLKGVSIKSLRYYEKINILKPAYIDPLTNYRYYTLQQEIILDYILMCLELKIPLKEFPRFLVTENKVDIDSLVKYAEEIAQKEITKINRTLLKLKNMQFHLNETSTMITDDISYYKERYFIAEKITDDYNFREYIRTLSKLYQIVENNNLTCLYNQGIIIIDNVYYIGIEIVERTSNSLVVEDGRYKSVLDNDFNLVKNSKSKIRLYIERYSKAINPIMLKYQFLEKIE